ncbi:MAG: DUF58 domain-containing protein [Planctomycetota bacterium]
MAQIANYSDLLDPAEVSKLGQLELIATRIVEGFVSGKHRSPFKGCSVEFAEHRAYSPGDEVRLIDWRVYAKRDRYYIKQFDEETNLQTLMVIDASGSMGFGLSTVTKLRYAQMAAACLARIMLHQQDAIGISVIDTNLREYVPPRSNPGHLQVLLEYLSKVQPRGETSLAPLLHELAKRIKRRGLIMIFSDCYDDVEALIKALHRLNTRGHETMLYHTMAPEELAFSFNRWSRFECLEIPGWQMNLDPAAIRKEYLKRVKIFLDRLQQGCGEVKCDYVPLTTDKPLGDTLAYYLARRAARMK